MTAQTVPSAFATVGTYVVVLGMNDSITNAKIIKVTKTQVTAEYRLRGTTQTMRFVPSRWNDRYETEMDQYGMRDAWSRGASLLLASDPSLPARRAARAKATAERTLRTAAAKFAAQKEVTAADLDEIQVAMDAYRATLATAN